MTTSDAQSIVNLALVMSLVGFLFVIVYYVWYALALSKLFPKLGAESWRGWVPVLNEMEILVRGGVPGWSVVYYFIPIVSLYGLYLKATAVHRINVQLGKGVGMTVLGVLLPPVWASILGWGRTAAVAGVYHKRVESMLGGGDAPAPSTASGPLAGQPTAFSPPPFTPTAASDASGYALPTPPPVPTAPPAPSTPPAAPLSFAAPAAPANPPAAAAPATPSTPVAAGSGMIQNPWAQHVPEAAPVSPPPIVTPSIVTPPAVVAPPVTNLIAPPPGVPDFAPPAAVLSTPPTIAETPVVPADPPVIPVAAEPAPVVVEPEPEAVVVAPAPAAHQPAAAAVPEPAAAAVPEPAAAAPILVTADAASESDDDDDDLDRTVVVDRRPVVPWMLHTDDGFSVALTASKIVLGRNPASKELDVESIAIPDTTRTLSKTHARLDLVDGAWTVTDLHSTNGVIVVGADDTESLIAVDEATPLLARFVLGKVGMRVSFDDEPVS